MRTILLFFTIVLVGLFLTACGSSRMAQVEQGTGYEYKAGHPEFLINAFGFIDEEQGPSLEISTHITKGSLVYSQDDEDRRSAGITVNIQIVDKDNPENIIESEQINKTVRAEDEDITNSREPVIINHTLQVEPSNYEISVTVEDNNSEKKLTQTTETYIPDTDEGAEAYTLSTIQMYGKENGDEEWSQLSGYDVQSKMDSLRFVFQVLSPQSDKQMTINSRLLEFKSDTTVPRSMTRNNYSPSSIEYKGIDFDKETEIQSNQRVLTDYSSIFVEYKFANQNRGNYRFEVTAQKEDEEEQYRARAFSIKSPNFPTIQNARELARPLVYLMDKKEYERLMEINDPDSLKQEVDRFWLKNIGNKSKTRKVIELYYTRVEEANKQYSNFKEGWKTDRGMIYILFGTPYHTRDRLKRMVWYYSYNREDPERRFIFEQPKLNNQYYPYDHYLLNRQNYYHTLRYNQRGLWLSGQILSRRI